MRSKYPRQNVTVTVELKEKNYYFISFFIFFYRILIFYLIILDSKYKNKNL